MRIGIDATAMPFQRVGAGNYILNITRSLFDQDRQNEYVVFAKKADVTAFQTENARAKIVPLNSNSRLARIVWEQVSLPAFVKSQQIDVLHSPHYTMPFAADCACVVTFHDMTFFLYPEMHKTYKRVFFRATIRLAAGRAKSIIADSESTRQDVLRILKINPAKVFAVPLGVAPIFHPVDDRQAIEAIRRKYGLPDRTILYVGVLEPRKNLPALITAFRGLVDRGFPHSLVIVGRKGWMYEGLFQKLRELDLTKRVIFTGYTPEEELPLLYNSADLFVYPSLYEGFGLPVLEAMACGTPVVTSNVSSMPEIAGDSGILVDPCSTEEIENRMVEVLTNRELHAEIARKGLERSKLFSWERTARESRAVYEQAL